MLRAGTAAGLACRHRSCQQEDPFLEGVRGWNSVDRNGSIDSGQVVWKTTTIVVNAEGRVRHGCEMGYNPYYNRRTMVSIVPYHIVYGMVWNGTILNFPSCR